MIGQILLIDILVEPSGPLSVGGPPPQGTVPHNEPQSLPVNGLLLSHLAGRRASISRGASISRRASHVCNGGSVLAPWRWKTVRRSSRVSQALSSTTNISALSALHHGALLKKLQKSTRLNSPTARLLPCKFVDGSRFLSHPAGSLRTCSPCHAEEKEPRPPF